MPESLTVLMLDCVTGLKFNNMDYKYTCYVASVQSYIGDSCILYKGVVLKIYTIQF